VLNMCKTRNSAFAEGPRDALSVEIESIAAQMRERVAISE